MIQLPSAAHLHIMLCGSPEEGLLKRLLAFILLRNSLCTRALRSLGIYLCSMASLSQTLLVSYRPSDNRAH